MGEPRITVCLSHFLDVIVYRIVDDFAFAVLDFAASVTCHAAVDLLPRKLDKFSF